MKDDKKSVKMLKKVDSTDQKLKKKRNQAKKLICKSSKSKKALKLLPGQQILTFATNILPEKQIQILCVDECSLGWGQQFTNKIMSHQYDNDQESTEHIVKTEVQRGIATLVQQITFRKLLEMENTIAF